MEVRFLTGLRLIFSRASDLPRLFQKAYGGGVSEFLILNYKLMIPAYLQKDKSR